MWLKRSKKPTRFQLLGSTIRIICLIYDFGFSIDNTQNNILGLLPLLLHTPYPTSSGLGTTVDSALLRALSGSTFSVLCPSICASTRFLSLSLSLSSTFVSSAFKLRSSGRSTSAPVICIRSLSWSYFCSCSLSLRSTPPRPSGTVSSSSLLALFKSNGVHQYTGNCRCMLLIMSPTNNISVVPHITRPTKYHPIAVMAGSVAARTADAPPGGCIVPVSSIAADARPHAIAPAIHLIEL
jgi:hypothetical protein